MTTSLFADRVQRTLLVMAGGTGGHIFPGMAVADVLRNLGWKVVWLGNPEGMEARLVPPHGYELVPLRFAALRGKGLWRKLSLPWRLLSACWQAHQALRRIDPDVVVGFGGFVSFPGAVMARWQRRPLVIHEQNSVAGLANRVLARIARRVLTGFPLSLPHAEYCGNPLRPEIAGLPEPALRFQQRSGPLHLLVLGGSLGATALNEQVPKAMALLTAAERPVLKHQAGEKHLDALRANYAAAGVDAECLPFIEDMGAAYAWADLVICRAGAITVAELAAVGVASILVPFPYAVDDHQASNARFLADAGAAIVLPQAELSAEKLALMRTLTRPQLLQMAERARALAKPDAAAVVARACMELAK